MNFRVNPYASAAVLLTNCPVRDVPSASPLQDPRLRKRVKVDSVIRSPISSPNPAKAKQVSGNDPRSTANVTGRRKLQILSNSEVILIDGEPLLPPARSKAGKRNPVRESSPEFMICNDMPEKGKEKDRSELSVTGKACACIPTIVQEGLNVDDVEDELSCPM